MPAIRRMARTCALTLVTPGVTATTPAVAPAHAAEETQRSGAVVLSESQYQRYEKEQAARKQRAAQRLNARITTAQRTAMAQRGDAYSYGSAGPNAFDCSGLVFYSYRRAGFNVPRTSGAQAAYTHRVALKQNMRPGDLMFFFNSGGVYHAAIFVGYQNGHAMMVHAPGSGQRVTVAAPLDQQLVRRHPALRFHCLSERLACSSERAGRSHFWPAPVTEHWLDRARAPASALPNGTGENFSGDPLTVR
ncbi:C40 family peptidase [Nocardioides sp. B-3]|uniref:C40 family peptidase n=1 Tax=Nocardioides sp. B-3 TaxID=2895565 RepID=UPI002152C7A0|nr:C40 family peptidase [Nocardioides sp. B-3]UUZ60121.1 C40 family peptidase [Nocardioides sp. B-3]